MKWFKHDSDASIDAKLQELLLDYGAAGYGLYWYCVELISKNVTPKNITFELEHDARIIARNLNLTIQETKNMMQKMVELGLFDINCNKRLSCVSLAYRLDDSMRKGRQVEEIINNFKGLEDSEKIPDDSGKSLLELDKDKDKDKELEEEEEEEEEERKRKEEEEKKKEEEKKAGKEMPTQNLVSDEIWETFIEVRKFLKAANTPLAINSLINELQRLKNKGHDPTDVVNQSIRSSWKDVYPIKENKKASAQVRDLEEERKRNKALKIKLFGSDAEEKEIANYES